MNREKQVPSLSESLETGLATTVQMDFPRTTLPIFWGPNQVSTDPDTYQEPTQWNEEIPLFIPQIVRFCYDPTPVETTSPPPPPPPPPGGRPVEWRLTDYFCSGLDPDGNPRVFGDNRGCIFMGSNPADYCTYFYLFSSTGWQLVYSDTNVIISSMFQWRTCYGMQSSCRCHPDCHGVNWTVYPMNNWIYSYPCGGNGGSPKDCANDGC